MTRWIGGFVTALAVFLGTTAWSGPHYDGASSGQFDGGTIGSDLILSTGDLEVQAGGLCVGFDCTPAASAISIGDTSFDIEHNSGNPLIRFDGTDFLQYTRAGGSGSTGIWDFQIASSSVMDIDAAGVGIHTGAQASLEFTNSGAGIRLRSNDASALDIGPAAIPHLMRFSSETGLEEVTITGTTAQNAFRVDTGIAQFDEDVSISGGVSALNLSSSGDSSILIADNDTTALAIGSTGALDIISIDTGNGLETVTINGGTTATGFYVASGDSIFQEDVEIFGGLCVGFDCTTVVDTIQIADSSTSIGIESGSMILDVASGKVIGLDVNTTREFQVNSTGASAVNGFHAGALGSATNDMFTTEANGGGQFGAHTSDPCGTLPEGALFYNTTSDYYCFCNGSGDDIKMNDNSTACF